jgi:hypothetical protein
MTQPAFLLTLLPDRGAADWPATIRAGVPASPAVAALLIGRSSGYDAERR